MYKIGIDYGGSHIAVALTYEEGDILAKSSIDVNTLDWNSMAGEKLTEMTVSLIKYCINESRINPASIDFVGIGIPGTPDVTKIQFLANMGIRNFDIGKELQNRFDEIGLEKDNIKISLANDADCAAVGEFVRGALRGSKYAINIVFGTGVGAGIIINRELYNGAHGSSGEIGHMTIDKNSNIQCGCGRRGCLETLCSVKRLRENISSKLGLDKVIEGTELKELLESGESSEISDLWATYKENLVLCLINMVNIFDPEKISIGGSLSYLIESDLADINKKVNEGCFNKEANYKIVKAKLENDAGLIGAAMLGYNI